MTFKRLVVVVAALAGVLVCLSALVFVSVQYAKQLVSAFGLEAVAVGAVIGLFVCGLAAFVAAFFDR